MGGPPRLRQPLKLLTDLLRSELSFDGLVVSDYRSVQRLLDDILATADDITDAALQCLTAGLDMELPDRLGYADGMTHAFAEGKVDISYLDRAVLRVLTLKFELGLLMSLTPVAAVPRRCVCPHRCCRAARHAGKHCADQK